MTIKWFFFTSKSKRFRVVLHVRHFFHGRSLALPGSPFLLAELGLRGCWAAIKNPVDSPLKNENSIVYYHMMIHDNDNIVESAYIQYVCIYHNNLSLGYFENVTCPFRIKSNGTFWAASSIPSKYAPSLGLGFMVFSCGDFATNLVDTKRLTSYDFFGCFQKWQSATNKNLLAKDKRTQGWWILGQKQDSLQWCFVASCKGLSEVLMEELWAQTLHWVGGQMSSSFLEIGSTGGSMAHRNKAMNLEKISNEKKWHPKGH